MVRIDTIEFRKSHCTEPRGRGGWFFTRRADSLISQPLTETFLIDDRDGEIRVNRCGDLLSTSSATYAAAKRAAKAVAAKLGWTTLFTQP